MCAFYLSDVSRGREPNRRLAFGKRLRFLALCSVSILADTLCRFAIYLKTALCRAAPLTSHFVRQRPFDIANESVSRGKNPTIGWRSAVACKRLRFSVQRTFCHCERNVAISRKGHRIIKPTQDTFVLAWRKKAHTSIRVSIVAPTMRFQKCSVRREQPR